MGGRELTDKSFPEIEVMSAAGVASGDYIPIYDASVDQVKKTALAANVAANSSTAADSVSLDDATTLTTVLALCNTLKTSLNAIVTQNATVKTSINAIITALKNANLMLSA